MSDQVRNGFVVGRFQPLHWGHVDYILAAFRRCAHLYVGITHPDPLQFFYHKSDPHRSKRSANPFSYELRCEMVRSCLLDLRFRADEFDIVPVRLESPRDIRAQVPLGTVVFSTIYDEWGEAKRQLFDDAGFRIDVLWRRKETITRGHDVRARIREGQEWEHLVPPTTASVIASWLAAGHDLDHEEAG
jgi:cytidyltransferase-like protein